MLKAVFEKVDSALDRFLSFEGGLTQTFENAGHNAVERGFNKLFAKWDKIEPFGFANKRKFESSHVHTHVFPAGMSSEDKKEFLKGVQETCEKAGIKFSCRSTKGSEVQFGFADKENYKNFVGKVFDDLYNPQGHIHTQSFSDGTYREDFSQASEIRLRQLGINYKLEPDGDSLAFKFDKVSDRLAFTDLIDNGSLDALAGNLRQTRSAPALEI